MQRVALVLMSSCLCSQAADPMCVQGALQGSCLGRDASLLQVSSGAHASRTVAQEPSAAPCEKTCDCWSLDAEGHTCGARITWARGRSGPHKGEGVAAAALVRDEFPDICTCARVERKTQRAACHEGCTCWGKRFHGHTCGARIEWAAGPRGPHSGDRAAAAALVRAEFPETCACEATGANTAAPGTAATPAPALPTITTVAPEPAPKTYPCHSTCACWGADAGGQTCAGRINLAVSPEGPFAWDGHHDGSPDFLGAAEFVRTEFPDTCACRPHHQAQEVKLPTPNPDGTYANYLEPVPSSTPWCEQTLHETECQLTCRRYEEDGDLTQVGSDHILQCKIATSDQCDEGWKFTRSRDNADRCCSCMNRFCGWKIQC